MSNKKKYKVIQIDAEVHAKLKAFCKEKGYSMKGLVESLVKERIEPRTPPKNVLKV